MGLPSKSVRHKAGCTRSGGCRGCPSTRKASDAKWRCGHGLEFDKEP